MKQYLHALFKPFLNNFFENGNYSHLHKKSKSLFDHIRKFC
jgi:hypothetical protein